MTNSGDLDGAFSYLYNGNQIIEVRNGADDVDLLVVHAEADQGGRAKGYIDKIVCQRDKDRGWAYVHQDANWNVTALTAMNGAVIGRWRCTHIDGQDHTWRCWPKAGTARPTGLIDPQITRMLRDNRARMAMNGADVGGMAG